MTSERPLGWWRVWLRRRQIDADRQWCDIRKGRKPPIALPDYRGSTPSFEDIVIAQLDLERAWPLLSQRQQEMLLLRAEGLSATHIASRFACTAGTVMTTVYRGRQTLRAACA